MPISASKLQSDIYRILDEVVRTGIPVEIEHDGRILEIVDKDKPKKLERLVARPFLNCDPEDIVHCDWLGEWKL